MTPRWGNTFLFHVKVLCGMKTGISYQLILSGELKNVNSFKVGSYKKKHFKKHHQLLAINAREDRTHT